MELLLKASGYLEFCVRDVLAHLHPDIKYINALPLNNAILRLFSIKLCH